LGAYEWIAIIGAAAWVPQIGAWLVRWLTNPKVKLIPGPQPEIGYTALGPILNLTCALSASNKDAVIEGIALEVRHERGQFIRFTWATLNETFSQIRGPEGTAEVSRNQPAIALKVSTLALVEKLIGFQVTEFQEHGRKLISALVDRNNFLRKTEGDPGPATARSKEMSDLAEYYRRSMPWQQGKYTAAVRIQIAGVRNPAVEQFTFELNANDIDRLSQNWDEIERYFRETYAPPTEMDRVEYRWQWINPRLRRLADVQVGAIRENVHHGG
jgi:hypothetical protein